ncbi:exodeoxyribonuclease VII small subunit [Candidatus Poribacteria bacterium]
MTKDVKFEDALSNLENIVEKLERGELSLEESLAAFEEGIRLSRICSKQLDAAEKKIEILIKGEDGNLKTENFGIESPEETTQEREAEGQESEA